MIEEILLENLQKERLEQIQMDESTKTFVIGDVDLLTVSSLVDRILLYSRNSETLYPHITSVVFNPMTFTYTVTYMSNMRLI